MIPQISKSKKGEQNKLSFPIVGMDGSAGSFHAFEKFSLHIPVKSGVAFVIVMHLDNSHHIYVIMEIVHDDWKTDKLDGLLLQTGSSEVFIQHNIQGLGLKDMFVESQQVNKRGEGIGLVSLITFRNQNSG